MNADYDVVLFNALKVYYFRTTVAETESEAPPEIQTALKTILTIIRRTFASNGNELHDRLQWPLFLAGIETYDGFYSDWILSRISQNRARAVLETVIQLQTYSGKSIKRLNIRQIRSSLFDGKRMESLALHGAGLRSFWDTLEEL
jgi:Fungal specific transcription factor domain